MRESPETRPSPLMRVRDPRDERAWSDFVAIYTPLIHRPARPSGLQGAGAEQPAPRPDATALFEEEYRRGLFQWAVGRIRGGFRESTWPASWQTAVEGRNPRVDADALGPTAGAVHVDRHRVVARLRKAIEEVEGGSPPDPT